MRFRVFKRVGIVLAAGAMVLAATGCNKLLYGTNSISIATGWLLGSAFTAGNVERVCYENGVLIDCADLPADLGQ